MSVEYQWVLDEYRQATVRATAREGKAGKRVNKIGRARKVTKGRIDNLVFQVNPTTIKFEGGGKWTNIDAPSRYAPFMQAGCDMPETITFDLYVNEWMINNKVNAEHFVAEIERIRNQHFGVQLVLGARVYLVIVTAYSMEVESFNPDLSIREATVSLTLTVIK